MNLKSQISNLSLFILCTSAVNLFAAPPEPKFEPQTIDDAISIGYGIDVGDVDGDGKPDLLLADAKQIVWYKNPGPQSRDREGAMPLPWSKHVIAENLTPLDNVCIAARDIDGDGKVEVAVGAQWNPGETSDPEKSGAIFYLIRPADPTQKWEPVQIKPHDPTTHRMRWVKTETGEYQLIVLPLHGVANVDAQGATAHAQVLTAPADVRGEWKSVKVDTRMHMTHNFDVLGDAERDEVLCFGGKEGFTKSQHRRKDGWPAAHRLSSAEQFESIGEFRTAIFGRNYFSAAIEPMHGNKVTLVVDEDDGPLRAHIVLDTTLDQGHALAVADMCGIRLGQVVAGWRQPNAEKKVGIRMYVPQDEKYENWKTYTIDDNTMACEDLKVHDLDGDGRPDIVASGRATKNVIVYWNRTPKAE